MATVSDRTVVIHDLRQRGPVSAPLVHDAAVNCVCFSPDNRRIATSTANRRVRLWDARTGHPLCDWIESPDPVPGVWFSPDGQWLLTTAGWRWNLCVAEGPVPPWLPELAEAVAGVLLDEAQQLHTVPATVMTRVRDMIAAASMDTPLAVWAKEVVR